MVLLNEYLTKDARIRWRKKGLGEDAEGPPPFLLSVSPERHHRQKAGKMIPISLYSNVTASPNNQQEDPCESGRLKAHTGSYGAPKPNEDIFRDDGAPHLLEATFRPASVPSGIESSP